MAKKPWEEEYEDGPWNAFGENKPAPAAVSPQESDIPIEAALAPRQAARPAGEGITFAKALSALGDAASFGGRAVNAAATGLGTLYGGGGGGQAWSEAKRELAKTAPSEDAPWLERYAGTTDPASVFTLPIGGGGGGAVAQGLKPVAKAGLKALVSAGLKSGAKAGAVSAASHQGERIARGEEISLPDALIEIAASTAAGGALPALPSAAKGALAAGKKLGAGLSGVSQEALQQASTRAGRARLASASARAPEVTARLADELNNPEKVVPDLSKIREEVGQAAESGTEISRALLDAIENPGKYTEEEAKVIGEALKQMPPISLQNTLTALDAAMVPNAFEPSAVAVNNRLASMKEQILSSVGRTGAPDLAVTSGYRVPSAMPETIEAAATARRDFVSSIVDNLRKKLSPEQFNQVVEKGKKGGKRTPLTEDTKRALESISEYLSGTEEGFDVATRAGFGYDDIPRHPDDILSLIRGQDVGKAGKAKAGAGAAGMAQPQDPPVVSAVDFRDLRNQLDVRIPWDAPEKAAYEKALAKVRSAMRQDLLDAAQAGGVYEEFAPNMERFSNKMDKFRRAKNLLGKNKVSRELKAEGVVGNLYAPDKSAARDIVAALEPIINQDVLANAERMSMARKVKPVGKTEWFPRSQEQSQALADYVNRYSPELSPMLDQVETMRRARDVIGATNETREKAAESVLSNLYGANKTKQREMIAALEALLGRDVMDELKTMANAKQFGPSGSPGILPTHTTGRAGLGAQLAQLIGVSGLPFAGMSSPAVNAYAYYPAADILSGLASEYAAAPGRQGVERLAGLATRQAVAGKDRK